MIKLSIDAMGGDHGLGTTVPAALEILRTYQKIKLILVGDTDQIKIKLNDLGGKLGKRLAIQHASQIVEMDEHPANALRRKKDSSMRVAINLVKDGTVDGCVSAGNTGALMATARFVLRTIPGIDRPAICASLPRPEGYTHMLDLGANIDTPPEILLQFGLMGSQLIDCLNGKKNPTIGLLNIGVEEIKGNESIKATAELFKGSNLNYIGFIEADEIYMGNTDLIVCDGFLGNVALKASEGVAQMIMSVLKEEFSRNVVAKGSGLLAKPVLNAIKRRLDHRRYNGASLLGLRGAVVKSHGGTDHIGFKFAIEVAIEETRKGLVNQIESAIVASSV
ncbi:phosphate acyltransferase PlsX [Candidatus Spongiihabitans sp.]|uniref:phosphate acyltransferase PlsX n=1 Tax=Candidatus Spongiihabitans sp. TaxID=3101308 RepID=UPI003C6ED7C0